MGSKTVNGLQSMANIGPKLAAQLQQAGIETPEALRAVGSREAWLRIRANDPSACIMRLCALEGALQGIRWKDLDASVKDDLRAFYYAHK